jgi:hypothetical protein
MSERRRPDAPAATDLIVAALVNSAMQAIAKGKREYGFGGLGDSRALRAAVREIVKRHLRQTRDGP